MKLNRLETHDRLEHLIKDQSDAIQQGCEDCLKKNPLSLAYQQRSPYIYIFAHPRTHDDGINKRMLWQPRLRKPRAEPNSYLFRAKSNSNDIEVCWMLPPIETWGQYKKGNVTESEMVRWSIFQYRNKLQELERDFSEDFKQEKVDAILLNIASEMEEDIKIRKLYPRQATSEAYSNPLVLLP